MFKGNGGPGHDLTPHTLESGCIPVESVFVEKEVYSY